MPPLLLGRVRQERADAGQFARRGRGPKPLPPAIGEKGAKIRCAEIEKPCRQDLLSTITAKKVDEAKRGADISAHRVVRAPAIVLEVRTPLRRERSGGMN